jgi:hypothetical protein
LLLRGWRETKESYMKGSQVKASGVQAKFGE